MTITILPGDCRAILATLPADSVQCCVTSPPYFGLRDYGVDGQIGLEPSPDEYVAELVAVFREVRRVLRADGTLWLNLGDSYAAGGLGAGSGKQLSNVGAALPPKKAPEGFKPKDLLMIPARVALALQADGWYLRSDIIWHKPNPMPESVTDRPTSAHEHVFLLTKAQNYYYDAEAIDEECKKVGTVAHLAGGSGKRAGSREGLRREEWIARKRLHPENVNRKTGDVAPLEWGVSGDPKHTTNKRNARNVWTIATQPFSGAHFATMPPDLVERCIKAGSRPGDMILDPFGGAGTTGLVADRLNRNATLIELNPEYAQMAQNRINQDAPLFNPTANP